MERSWWWKAAFYGAVTLLACLYIVPTLIPDPAKRPAIVQKLRFDKRIQQGLDLAGGLRLVYAVNVEKAVSNRVDQIATAIEDNLQKKTRDFRVGREGRDEISFQFIKNPADVSKLDSEVLAEYRDALDEVVRDQAKGLVRYRLDPAQMVELEENALTIGIERIRDRVDKFGVSEPNIIKKGTDIVVELPGLEERDFERIKAVVGRTAQLQFKIVDDQASEYTTKVAASRLKDSPITIQPDSWRDDKTGVNREVIYLVAKDREVLEKFISGLTGDLAVPNDREFGYEAVDEPGSLGSANRQPATWRAYLLYRRAGVTGDYLQNAEVGFSEMGTPQVNFTMHRKGGELMGKLTGENVGRRMAIVLDDKIMSAPVIQSQINDRGLITLGAGMDPVALQQEAKDLVAVLRSGSLPAPLQKTHEMKVGRTLGDDAVAKARFAMLLGGIGVVLFMLIYYKGAGIIANIAMGLNMLYLLAALAGFEAALTLPGIAGLGLSIGMAMDANIVIYERIREELRAGKSPRSAVDAGFNRAFWTVFDAHVTNLIAGIVLYSYGSGPIRGFAVTLVIGIISNLFTSVWMSRWMFDVVVGRRGSSPATLSI
jgi:preprotein translocase subunit SecD